MKWLLDSNVVVTLAQREVLLSLVKGPHPFWVPEQVDDELTAHPGKYPTQQRQYEDAKVQRLIEVIDLPVGSAEFAEYTRLRKTRSSPARNKGEDACVAVALVRVDSLICTDDERGLSRAERELGINRVRRFSELLKLLGL